MTFPAIHEKIVFVKVIIALNAGAWIETAGEHGSSTTPLHITSMRTVYSKTVLTPLFRSGFHEVIDFGQVLKHNEEGGTTRQLGGDVMEGNDKDSTEDVEKMFNQDSKEKKRIGNNVKYRATRLGRVGKMLMPSDLSKDHKYARNSRTLSYSVEDILSMLQETSTLKELLMERLDAEYEHYRLAIDRTLSAVGTIVEKPMGAVNKAMIELLGVMNDMNTELNDTRQQLAQLQAELDELRDSAMWQGAGLDNKEVIKEDEGVTSKEKDNFVTYPSTSTVVEVKKTTTTTTTTEEVEKVTFGYGEASSLTDEQVYQLVYDSLDSKSVPLTIQSFTDYLPAMNSMLYRTDRRWQGVVDFRNSYATWKENRGLL